MIMFYDSVRGLNSTLTIDLNASWEKNPGSILEL